MDANIDGGGYVVEVTVIFFKCVWNVITLGVVEAGSTMAFMTELVENNDQGFGKAGR